MMRALAIFKRDILKFIRNPLIILMSVLMPLIYLLVVGNTIQGDLKNLPIAIVNHDQGLYSRRIMEMMQAIEAGPKTLKAYYLNDEKEALNDLKEGVFSAVLIIPVDFSKDIVRSSKPEIGLFLDNIDIFSANAIYNTIALAMPFIIKEFIPIRVDSSSPVLRSIEVYKKIDYDQSLIPGIVIMSIFMGTMGTGVFNLIMDRFLGVHESYLSTPLTKWDIVLGLTMSGVLLTTVESVIVFEISSLITGIVITKIWVYLMILLLIILTSLGLLGMMFILLSRADHPRIVGIFGGFLNVILFFPSGAIYPIASFPKWLQEFSKVNPESYAVHAIRSLLFRGADIMAIKTDLIFLTSFTVIMISVATITFKRRL